MTTTPPKPISKKREVRIYVYRTTYLHIVWMDRSGKILKREVKRYKT